MNKQELVDVLAADCGVLKKDAEKIVNVLMATIIKSVARGEKITLVGFGSFDARHRKARSGRNPKTGEVLTIAAKTAASFKAGKEFADAVDKRSK